MTAEDWQEWRPVRLAALAEAPDAFGSTLQDWADAPEHRWRTRLSLPGAIDLLAFEDDRAVAMASGVPDPDRQGTAELISMWVAPEARGRGVASRLIDAIVAWAAEHGVSDLELSVMPDNTRAGRTYERSGFVATDQPGDELPDGRHELVMRKELDR